MKYLKYLYVVVIIISGITLGTILANCDAAEKKAEKPILILHTDTIDYCKDAIDLNIQGKIVKFPRGSFDAGIVALLLADIMMAPPNYVDPPPALISLHKYMDQWDIKQGDNCSILLEYKEGRNGD